jgi:hypothetical protein
MTMTANVRSQGQADFQRLHRVSIELEIEVVHLPPTVVSSAKARAESAGGDGGTDNLLPILHELGGASRGHVPRA